MNRGLFVLIATILFAMASCGYFATQQIRCNDRGGVYVRQWAGYECVMMERK